jgi:DNA-directed RNA polymerase subunit RPC12/RpoP
MKNCYIMPYVICEECSGYYELQEGESPDDFGSCQCGGKLEYAEKIHETTEKEDKLKFICSNCLKESEEGIFCPNCGGKLVSMKNRESVSNTSFDKSKELERLSKNASKRDNKFSNELELLFNRINWLGIIVGAVFFIVSVFVTAVLLALARFELIIFIMSSSLLALASGALEVYIGKSRKYVDGIVTGFLVGLIFI